MSNGYTALWSRRQPQIVIVTDESDAIVDLIELTLPFRHRSWRMLSETEWSPDPDSEWVEVSPGEWSIQVFSFQRVRKESENDASTEGGKAGTTMQRDVDCLGKLGAELCSKGLKCELVTTGSCAPYLHIKAAGDHYRSISDLQDHVFVSTEPDGKWRFWWPWIEPIALVEEMTRAVGYIVELYQDGSNGMSRRDS